MPLHYFLKIDGLKGDSTVEGFEGWFSVDGYDIGVRNTASLSTGKGNAQFSPLTVDIHSRPDCRRCLATRRLVTSSIRWSLWEPRASRIRASRSMT